MTDKSDLNVFCDFELTESELDALVTLYQPLFSFPALNLYLSLLYASRRGVEVNSNEIMHSTQLDRDQLVSFRKELERFGLIRTFESKDTLSLLIVAPLQPHKFLTHPTFGRLYSIILGRDAYLEKSKLYQVNTLDLDNALYKEISESFDISRLSAWDESYEKVYNTQKVKEIVPNGFDVSGFFKQMSPMVFPNSLRTASLIDCVQEYGTLYKLTFSDMRSLLFAATNFEKRTFNHKRFVYLVEKHHGIQTVESVENPYDLDPISFLAYKQNHEYVGDADRNLLDSLIKNFGFENDVVNVLIEYILNTNDKNLSRNLVEKIAATWKRRGVHDRESALKQTKSTPSSSNNKKTIRPKVEIEAPVYSQDDTIEEDVNDLKSRLRDKLSQVK